MKYNDVYDDQYTGVMNRKADSTVAIEKTTPVCPSIH